MHRFVHATPDLSYDLIAWSIVLTTGLVGRVEFLPQVIDDEREVYRLGSSPRSGRIFGTQPQPNSHLGKNKAIKKIPTDLDLSRWALSIGKKIFLKFFFFPKWLFFWSHVNLKVQYVVVKKSNIHVLYVLYYTLLWSWIIIFFIIDT